MKKFFPRLSINSYEELLSHLRNCIHWDSTDLKVTGRHYDFVGIVDMMLACLDNLRENALEAELEDIGMAFDEDQAAFFKKICHILQNQSRTLSDVD